MKNKLWFRVPKELFDSDEIHEIFSMKNKKGNKRRDQHKIIFFLIVLQSLCDRQVEPGESVTPLKQFTIRWLRLSQLCHINVTTLKGMLEICTIFGVEVLHNDNNIVTFRYDNYLKLFKNYKETKNIRNESDTDRCLETNKTDSGFVQSNNVYVLKNKYVVKPEYLDLLKSKYSYLGESEIKDSINDLTKSVKKKMDKGENITNVESYLEGILKNKIENYKKLYNKKENDIGEII